MLDNYKVYINHSMLVSETKKQIFKNKHTMKADIFKKKYSAFLFKFTLKNGS